MTLIRQNLEASTLKYIFLLAMTVILFASTGAIASYSLNSIYFAMTEPYIFPCSSARNNEACRIDEGELDHGQSVLFYSWPIVDTTHLHYEPSRACVPDFLYHLEEN